MGMFTTIVDPETGIEVQIKTGADFCEVFKVGEKLENIHGVFHGLSPSDSEDPHKFSRWLVVIKRNEVMAVRPEEDSRLLQQKADLIKEFDL